MAEISRGELIELNSLSNKVIGAGIAVHRVLGPGLLESAYEECLCHELTLRSILFTRQVSFPIEFKGIQLCSGFRLDILVENQLIIELKSVDELLPVHSAQLFTYLKLTGLHLGLLMNFNVQLMKNGIRRVVNELPEPDPLDVELAEERRKRWEARND